MAILCFCPLLSWAPLSPTRVSNFYNRQHGRALGGFYFIYFSLQGWESMLGKYSTTQLHPAPLDLFYIQKSWECVENMKKTWSFILTMTMYHIL
jgi:hypothetical protein